MEQIIHVYILGLPLTCKTPYGSIVRNLAGFEK